MTTPQSGQPEYLTLRAWAALALPGREPSLFTLRKYARDGMIEPAPVKIGKLLYVRRNARLIGEVPLPRLGRRAPARPRQTNPHTALYRHFDAAGRLLYVGISLNALARLMEHARSSHWVRQVATITIEHFPTRAAAVAAEAAAIVAERPLHNIAGAEVEP